MSPGRSAVVVDTMVVSALVNAHRNRAPAAAFRETIADRPIVVSFATVTEMRYGALKAGWGELRRRGLEFPCVRIEAIDRDGKPCKPGVYNLTSKDRRIIYRWLATRQKGNIDLTLAGLVAMACVCVELLARLI